MSRKPVSDPTTEHPFAEYLRILGRGKTSKRSLTREEACSAFRLVLGNQVHDLQLGAFLMLLRVNGESADEIAGFALAVRESIHVPRSLAIDIDWPSYAGKHKQHPWFILSAFLLSNRGYRILMHGSRQPTPGRLTTHQVLLDMGLPIADGWQSVEQCLSHYSLAYLPLDIACPPLDRFMGMRSLLGVRSPIHSLVKLVNFLNAPLSLQSVFHPAYLAIHQQAGMILGFKNSLILKGEGGEVEYRPDADNRLLQLRDGSPHEEHWKRHLHARAQPDPDVGPATVGILKTTWEQDAPENHYGVSAIIGTTAMVLSAAGLADGQEHAWRTAEQYWKERDRFLLRKITGER